MAALLPPTWAFLTWLLAFVLGVLAGRFYERHKETMTMRDIAAAYKGWYSRWDALVVTVIAVVAAIGILIGASAMVTNGQQDRRADAAEAARDSAFKQVQQCFDKYAEDQSASSIAVREASVVKDEASRVFNQALNDEGRAFKRLVKKILAQDVQPADVKRLYDTLDERDRTGRAVERAQRELDRARAENPVPGAPSTFCSVKP